MPTPHLSTPLSVLDLSFVRAEVARCYGFNGHVSVDSFGPPAAPHRDGRVLEWGGIDAALNAVTPPLPKGFLRRIHAP